jgi:hypothetical protein
MAWLMMRARQPNPTAEVRSEDDFQDLAEVRHRLLGFQHRYEQTAQPFDWQYTRTDLDRLLWRAACRLRARCFPCAWALPAGGAHVLAGHFIDADLDRSAGSIQALASAPLEFVGSPATITATPSTNLRRKQWVQAAGTAFGARGRTIAVVEEACFSLVQGSGCYSTSVWARAPCVRTVHGVCVSGCGASWPMGSIVQTTSLASASSPRASSTAPASQTIASACRASGILASRCPSDPEDQRHVDGPGRCLGPSWALAGYLLRQDRPRPSRRLHRPRLLTVSGPSRLDAETPCRERLSQPRRPSRTRRRKMRPMRSLLQVDVDRMG